MPTSIVWRRNIWEKTSIRSASPGKCASCTRSARKKFPRWDRLSHARSQLLPVEVFNEPALLHLLQIRDVDQARGRNTLSLRDAECSLVQHHLNTLRCRVRDPRHHLEGVVLVGLVQYICIVDARVLGQDLEAEVLVALEPVESL